MKLTNPLISVCILFSLMISSCGTSPAALNATSTKVAADIFGTQTAQAPTSTITFTPSPTSTNTPTSTPTPTSTSTPTPTPTPTPGLSSLAITLDDLPPGFDTVSQGQLRILKQSLSEGSSGFGFEKIPDYEIIMGFIIPLNTRQEQLSFDSFMPMLVDIYAQFMGANNSATELTDIYSLGLARAGKSFIGPLGNVSIRWDILTFRRNSVAIMLIHGHADRNTLDISILDIARLMDERIILRFLPTLFVKPGNADSIAGTWTGSIIGSDDSIISDVVVEIQNDCVVGNVCGTVIASQFPCSGDLFLKETIGNTFVFEEQEMSGSDSCFSGGLEYVRLLSSGKLLWRFEYTSASGDVTTSKALLEQR